jgi:hypothetical protein
MRFLRIPADDAVPGTGGSMARALRRLLGGDARRRTHLLPGAARPSPPGVEGERPRERAAPGPSTPGDRWFAQI